MKRSSILFALLLVSFLGIQGKAGEVRFDGDVGYFPPVPVGGIGTIEVRFDLDPLDTLMNGGVEFTVLHDNLGLIEFISAEIIDRANRWTVSPVTLTDNSVRLFAASVLSPGLPQGGQNVLFATIDYKRVGHFGVSNLTYDFGPFGEALVDGRDLGIDVTPNYYFAPNIVAWIPEPATLAMAGLGLIGVVLRRRNG
jgi:hypothetical protein